MKTLKKDINSVLDYLESWQAHVIELVNDGCDTEDVLKNLLDNTQALLAVKYGTREARLTVKRATIADTNYLDWLRNKQEQSI